MNHWLMAALSGGVAALACGCNASLGSGTATSTDAAVDGSAPCPALDGQDQLTAFRVADAITVDGTLAEATWAKARSVEFTNAARSENKVTVKIAWDDDRLYLACSVTDQVLETADTTRVFQDDGAELYLDTAHNKTTQMDADDYHFIVNIVGDIQIDNADVDPATFPTRAVSIIGGYSMEIAIPWGLAGGVPEAGRVMGMLLGNNDRDNGSNTQFDWTGVIDDGTGSYDRPNLWGDLVLAATLADGSCP